jgi:GNAT superfamily N-acetyltransferase
LPLAAIHQLRLRAWAAEGLLPPGTRPDGSFTDPLDESARHWVVHAGGILVGAARLTVHTCGDELPDADQRHPKTVALPGPVAALNRLVICPDHRGRRFARLLDQARVEAARASGCLFAVVAAHGPRVSALQACGFAVACGAVSRFLSVDGVERLVESAVLVLPFGPPDVGTVAVG